MKSPEKGQGELWRHLARFVQALGRAPHERDRTRLCRQLVRLAAAAQRVAEDCGLADTCATRAGADDAEAGRLRRALAEAEQDGTRLAQELAEAQRRLSDYRGAVACLCRLLANGGS